MDPFALWTAWTCWALWTTGVTLHWLAGVYLWQWRLLVPLSSGLELAAFLIFLRAVSGHHPEGPGGQKLDEWVFVVIVGSIGLLAALLANFGIALVLSVRGVSPDIPLAFDQRLLVLETWGFLVPFVCG